MDQRERLQRLLDQVNEAKAAKIKAEATMEELRRREQEILARLQAKGFDPNRLEEERRNREERLASLLDEAERILNEKPTPNAAEQEVREPAAAGVRTTSHIVITPDNDVPF